MHDGVFSVAYGGISGGYAAIILPTLVGIPFDSDLLFVIGIVTGTLMGIMIFVLDRKPKIQ